MQIVIAFQSIGLKWLKFTLLSKIQYIKEYADDLILSTPNYHVLYL